MIPISRYEFEDFRNYIEKRLDNIESLLKAVIVILEEKGNVRHNPGNLKKREVASE